MKRIYTILACLLLLTATLPIAATNVAGAEAEFKKLSKTYTLNSDGSQTLRVQKELTIYTHTAMNRTYGETFIQYDPRWQQVKINSSYTKQKDGTLIKTPANAFVEVLPAAAADAPAYNALKELVVVHTGLDLGSTIYLDYTITSKAGYLPALDILCPVKELSPVDLFTLKVAVPEGKPLHYASWNLPAQPVTGTKNGVKTLTWTLKNIAPRPYAYPYEHNAFGVVQQIGSGMMPAISVNTYPSRKEALKHLRAQFAEGDAAVIKAKADEITTQAHGNATGAQQLIDKYIGRLAAHTCGVSLTESGYRIRPASEVIRTNYGTAAELSNLSYCLQKAAGLNAELLISSLQTKEADKDGVALSGIIATTNPFASVGKTHSRIEALQDYLSVTNLEGGPYLFKKENKEVVAQDTINVANLDTKLQKADNYRIIRLKDADAVAALYPYVGNTTIKENILLPGLINRKEVTTVLIPAGRQWLETKGKNIHNAAGDLSFTYALQGNTLTVTRKLIIRRQLYTPADYAELYALLSEWKDINNRTIVLK